MPPPVLFLCPIAVALDSRLQYACRRKLSVPLVSQHLPTIGTVLLISMFPSLTPVVLVCVRTACHLSLCHTNTQATSKCRGYQSLGANVTRYEDGFQRDWHEAIDVYYEVCAMPWAGNVFGHACTCPSCVAYLPPVNSKESTQQISVVQIADSTSKSGGALSPSRIHGLNQWPDAHVPQVRATMNHYVGCMNHVGAAVMRGIALGLNLADPAFFEARNQGQDPYWCMRIIHYPPLADAERSKGTLPEQESVQPSSASAAGAAHGQVNAESALAGESRRWQRSAEIPGVLQSTTASTTLSAIT